MTLVTGVCDALRMRSHEAPEVVQHLAWKRTFVTGLLSGTRVLQVTCVLRQSENFLLVWPCPVVAVTNRRGNPEIELGPFMKANAQDLVTLSTSKNGLKYLTANDWALVADKAQLVQFKKGAALVQKGRRSNGVYLLLKGTVRVQIPSPPAGRRIGAGEICGEMSFLEDEVASASAVADGDVEVCHLDRANLQVLFELYPHLASRFYRSLARNLSRRLREIVGPATDGMPSLLRKRTS